jgi:hypothetical protein
MEVYYARMVDTVYQPPAAMSPQRASWQKEISNAPRRNGKQQKKWRAGMMKRRVALAEGERV